MNIETTINIKKAVLKKIDSIAEEYHVSRSKLVSLLLKQVMKEQTTDKNRFSQVKYQRRDKKASWKRPHIMLNQDIYEKCLDLRKISKKSVSYLVLIAYNAHLERVIEKLKNVGDTDNYLSQYICIGKRIGSIYSYVIFWDFPPQEHIIKFLE